jgi:cell division protein FtsI/penicillin-binding protein 2
VTLREAMYGPTNNPGGTLTGRFHVPPGIKVGGKTGTAEAGSKGQLTHAWVMAFAGPAGGTPTVALSVVLLNRQGGQGDVTGGQLAGPVADVIMQKALEVADAEPANPTALITTPQLPPAPPAGGSTTATTTR